MFMWRLRFPWLNITALCSGEERGGKMIDGVTAGEVRLEIGNYRLFSNATTVLPLSGIVEGDTGAFAGPRVHPLICNWFPKRQESQDRRIIPV
jgi:hypothetical protein